MRRSINRSEKDWRLEIPLPGPAGKRIRRTRKEEDMKRNRFKVVITDREYPQIQEEKRILQAAGADIYDYQYRDPEQILRVAKDCDALIVQYARVPEALIRELSHCRIIARYATGVDGIDLEAAGKRGIYVTNVKEYCTEEVAAHTLALLLALSRKTELYDRLVKNGIWDYKAGLPCRGIKGQIVGIIGYGKIARSFAKKVKSLGGRVWIASNHASCNALRKEGIELKSREELICRADYVSLHIPLTEENRHLFSRETFRKMKRTACLINTARGGLVCERDLEWALREGEIAGAALDVLEQEPPEQDNPLLSLDNIILTPHMAWYSEESQRRLQSAVAEDVARVLLGGTPENCVNLDFFNKRGF